MKNRWSDEEAKRSLDQFGPKYGEDLAIRTYSSRLLGAEPGLALHGGGNTSVKGTSVNILGETIPTIYVKASGSNLATIEPAGHTGLRLDFLRKLLALSDISDEQMIDQYRTQLIDPHAATPSVETLVHAILPAKFIDHTHAGVILALTNQANGRELIQEALGDDLIVLDYVEPGFRLAKAVAAAYSANTARRGMVWMWHGLITWGDTAREAYEAHIEFATKAEEYLARKSHRPLIVQVSTPLATAGECLSRVAPIVRGLLARPTGDGDQPYGRVILRPLVNQQVLDFLDSDRGKEVALTPALTGDHLIRTKALPVWVDAPAYDDLDRLREQISRAVQDFAANYDAYFERHKERVPKGLARFDSLPRLVLMPGLGALCAGENVEAADIVRDITAHTLDIKAKVAAIGAYVGLSEEHLFALEYRVVQHAKLKKEELPLDGQRGRRHRGSRSNRVRDLRGITQPGMPRGRDGPAQRQVAKP